MADDKVMYAFVPAMIRDCLDQEPLIPNVELPVCSGAKTRDYGLAAKGVAG